MCANESYFLAICVLPLFHSDLDNLYVSSVGRFFLYEAPAFHLPSRWFFCFAQFYFLHYSLSSIVLNCPPGRKKVNVLRHSLIYLAARSIHPEGLFSPLKCLTSVFGMGTGVTTSPLPPDLFRYFP